MVRASSRATVRGLIFLIGLYRNMISPLRPASCRFVPTCSQYALDALGEYGVLRGSWLAVARLAKCGPWHQGGWDPIPARHGCGDASEAAGNVWDSSANQGESESRV